MSDILGLYSRDASPPAIHFFGLTSKSTHRHQRERASKREVKDEITHDDSGKAAGDGCCGSSCSAFLHFRGAEDDRPRAQNRC